MPVTASDIKALVVAEVGDPTGIIETNWDVIWASYADKALIWPRLQELYSKRRSIQILMGQIRTDVDFTISAALHGTTDIKVSQRFRNLQSMLTDVEQQISSEELQARAFRPGSITQLTRTEIELAPGADPIVIDVDANSPVYRGDPYQSPGLGTGSGGSSP